MIPAHARVYGQLVESPVLQRMSRLVPHHHPHRSSDSRTAPHDGATSSGASEAVSKAISVLSQLDTAAQAASTNAVHDGHSLRSSPSAPAPSTASGPSNQGGHVSTLHPVVELHVDALHEAGLLRPLGPPHQLLHIDLAAPPVPLDPEASIGGLSRHVSKQPTMAGQENQLCG